MTVATLPTPRYDAAVKDLERRREIALTGAFVDGLGVMSFVLGRLTFQATPPVEVFRELDRDFDAARLTVDDAGLPALVALWNDLRVKARLDEGKAYDDFLRKAAISFHSGVGVLLCCIVLAVLSLLLGSDVGMYLGTAGLWACLAIKFLYDRGVRKSPSGKTS